MTNDSLKPINKQNSQVSPNRIMTRVRRVRHPDPHRSAAAGRPSPGVQATPGGPGGQ